MRAMSMAPSTEIIPSLRSSKLNTSDSIHCSAKEVFIILISDAMRLMTVKTRQDKICWEVFDRITCTIQGIRRV